MEIATEGHGGRRAPTHQGFTLLEMLTATALLAIVAVGAVPAAHTFLVRNQVIAAAGEFVAALNLSRLHAITQGGNALMCPADHGSYCTPAAGWHRGWIVFADQNHNRQREPAEPLIRRHGPVAGVRIVSSAARRRIQFRPDGASYGSNATFLFCPDTQQVEGVAVVLSNPGRVRITRHPSPTQTALCGP
ncbi:MAG: GspH/FimT family pseudopilin [Gammaproteobacteria bacterium]